MIVYVLERSVRSLRGKISAFQHGLLDENRYLGQTEF